MRRPQMDPQEADATVRARTVQGMARGRVPSAYPVPRQRVPRILGGLKGIASAPAAVCIHYPPPYEATGGGVGTDYCPIGWGDAAADYYVQFDPDPGPTADVDVTLYDQDTDDVTGVATWDGTWWTVTLRGSTLASDSVLYAVEVGVGLLALADVYACPVGVSP